MERTEALAEEGSWAVVMQEHESPLVDVRFLRVGEEAKAVEERGEREKDFPIGKAKKKSWTPAPRAIVCKHCGVISQKHSFKYKFCSHPCYTKYRLAYGREDRPTAECPICGTYTLLCRKAFGVSVCSNRCAGTYYARVNRGRPQARSLEQKTVGKMAVCLNCNKKYSKLSYNQLLCSRACSNQLRQKRRAAARALLESKIGKCGLCGTSCAKILAPSNLGLNRTNGVAKFHIDHLQAVAHGGGDGRGNQRFLCWACNYFRSDLPSQLDYAIVAAGRAFWDAFDRLPSEVALVHKDLHWGSKSPGDIPVSQIELAKNIKDGVNTHV